MKRLYVCDMGSLCAWLYFSKPDDPNGMIDGLKAWFAELVRDLSAEYVVACLDGGSEARKAIDPEYKLNRTLKPKPESYVEQLRRVPETLDSIGVKWLRQSGHEADDLIASVVANVDFGPEKQVVEKQVVVVSTDKDMDCLVFGDTVVRYDPRPNKNGECVMYTTSDVIKKHGVAPYRITDLLAMAGDPSDGINGIEGIGKTYAAAAIKQISSMRELFRKAREGKLHDLSEKTQKKIADGEAQFWHCRRLVELREDLIEPTTFEAFELSVGSPLRVGHRGMAHGGNAAVGEPGVRGVDVRVGEVESGVSGVFVSDGAGVSEVSD